MKIQSFDQSLKSYSGRNNFSEQTNLDPTQFRSISNVDIYSGSDGDYLRVRRGSNRLVSGDSPIRQLGSILNKMVFPVAGEEYLICAYNPLDTGNIQFSSQALLNVGNPINVVSSSWEIDSSTWMSNLVLFGVTPANSDNLTLYFYWDSTAGGVLNIYSDVGLTTRVGGCTTPVADQTNIILEDSGSGISGTFYGSTLGATETGTFSYAQYVLQTSDGTPDLKIFNNRVYAFQQGANTVIEYDSIQGIFKARSMGLHAPVIQAWDSPSVPSDIDTSAAYYYGIERVIQKNGADLLASTPNRKFPDGTIPLTLPTNGSLRLKIEFDTINDDSNWTHIRVWRSKSTVPDISNPLFPINAQGEIDQLYELCLITRKEIYSDFGAIATDDSLPAGNGGISAGLDSGSYYVEDTNPDSVLTNLIDLDLIELVPIPGCRVGELNNGTIFASGIGANYLTPNPAMFDPAIAEDVLYTTNAFSQYQEQLDPQAFLNAGRDGKKTTALITLVQDLIVIREGMTKRIQGGNPDAGIVSIDDKIGVTTFRMVGYIPALGICAICSDKYFRYLSFGLQWTPTITGSAQIVNGISTSMLLEVSQSIYDLTSANFNTGIADFAYINGKLLMLFPNSNIGALGVKERKGWSEYSLPNNQETIFNFSNTQRVACASGFQYLVELETTGIVDQDGFDSTRPDIPIQGDFETYGFSGDGGLIEATRYSFWGLLGAVAKVIAKVSGQTWTMLPSFQDPGLYASNTALNEREYRFEPQPQDIGVFKWLPLRGQWISFEVQTIAPAMISWQRLIGRTRQTNGNQGPFIDGGIIPQGPGWANQSLMLLNFEDPANIFYDASGKGLNSVWVPNGGTKTNRVSQKPGKGVLIGGGGYLNYSPDPSLPLTGILNLAWKVVFSLSSSGNFSASGKNGSLFWSFIVNDSSATFSLSNGSVAYTWTCTISLITSIVYSLVFVLKKTYVGQFFINDISLSQFLTTPVTTRSDGASAPTSSAQIIGVYSPHLSSLTLTGWSHETLYGAYFSGAAHVWYLWLTAAERDANNPATTVAYVPMLNEAATLPVITQNGSGISGTVVNDGSNVGDDGNLDVVYQNSLPDGHTIKPLGTVSYYEIIQSDLQAEQAQRFWGIVKAYP